MNFYTKMTIVLQLGEYFKEKQSFFRFNDKINEFSPSKNNNFEIIIRLMI